MLMDEMKTYPKVLLAAPTSDRKDYCFIDWYLNVKNLIYPNMDILLVDNSEGREYFNYLKCFDLQCKHVEPRGRNTQEFITESQNVIRDYFLKGDYDYLFSLESDVFPMQEDVIQRLILHDLPVVTAPYMIGQGRESELLIGYYIKSFVQEDAIFGIVLPRKYGFFVIDGTVKEVAHSGIGCTLIHREIVERFPFRVEKGKVAHSDSYFFTDIFQQGIPSFIDTGCLAIHRNQDWGLIHNTLHEKIQSHEHNT